MATRRGGRVLRSVVSAPCIASIFLSAAPSRHPSVPAILLPNGKAQASPFLVDAADPEVDQAAIKPGLADDGLAESRFTTRAFAPDDQSRPNAA
jgi:hypothetical protein